MDEGLIGGWGDRWGGGRRAGHEICRERKEGQRDGAEPRKGRGRRGGGTDGQSEPPERPPAALLLMLTLALASLAATRFATRHT